MPRNRMNFEMKDVSKQCAHMNTRVRVINTLVQCKCCLWPCQSPSGIFYGLTKEGHFRSGNIQ